MFNQKKRKDLVGRLLEPLYIGKPARISTAAGILVTSAVEHFTVSPSGNAFIETQHTMYTLKAKQP